MTEYVTWKESYSVGDSGLDAEHKQILENIDQLYLPLQGRKPGLAAERLVNLLAEHTRAHFEHEEDRLKEVAYTYTPDHKALHDAMIQRMDDIQLQLMSLTPCEVLQFLRDWWLEHIEIEDKKFIAYLSRLKVWENRHRCE